MDDGQRQGWAVVLYTSTGCEAWPEVRCASMVVAPCTLAEADQVMRAVPEGFAPHRVAVERPAAFLAGEPPPLRLGARRGPGDPTGDPPLVPEGDPAGDQAVLRSAPERDQPTVKGTMTMPYQTGWQRVRIWVAPRPGPGGPPDWGLPEGGAPGQGLPEYPDQGLPRPPWTRPGRPPDWGLPEGDQPGQGLPPGWGGGWRPGQPPDWGIEEGAPGQGLPGGWPERPGHGLPWPGRPVYPVVDDPDDLGGHPEIPDLNMTHRILITDGSDQFTGYVLMFEPPQVEDDYEPRHPSRGLPGTWVTVLYGAHLAWAWVRTPGSPPEPPEHPEREPKM